MAEFPEKTGRPRRLRLPRSRALSCDVLHYHAKVPTCAHDRLCDLSEVIKLRSELPERISWALLFIKAFGLVARDFPVLRQTYQAWPWPHIYEHPVSVGMLAIQREFRGEPWLFWGRFSQPESQSLADMQKQLARYLSEPVTAIFKRQWQLSGFPTPAAADVLVVDAQPGGSQTAPADGHILFDDPRRPGSRDSAPARLPHQQHDVWPFR